MHIIEAIAAVKIKTIAINAQSDDMNKQDLENLNRDRNQDEDQLVFQTDAQRKHYQRMLSDEKHSEPDLDEDEITTVISKIGHRVWHRMFD